ncbi:MAG: LytTR family DNA-binding domain-containing protein [Clostridiales bacterium]|nr:LytTR family DNA-binding domain-containing protein [Clostridiales bacterium]
MTRVAIVEDDPIYSDQLQQYLNRYEQESGEKFLPVCFSDGVDLVEHYSADYDILLLDIEMPGLDGMTAAERIRKVDREVVIIFITNMSQYAIQGYAVEALDYVLKPISYYSFTQCIQRAMERMRRRTKQFHSVSTGKGETRKLELSQIYFMEVQKHTLIYHTTEGEITASGAMSEVEQELQGRFFRCNKGYLVNLEHVSSIQGDLVTVGGQQLQVSRAKKKPLLDALNNYINEVSK